MVVWNISLKELIPILLYISHWNRASLKYILKGIDTLYWDIWYTKIGLSLKYILKGIDTTFSGMSHAWNMLVWNISLKELIHKYDFHESDDYNRLKYILKGIDTSAVKPDKMHL